MLADRGPPKKRQKKTLPASTETSIVAASSIPTRMIFPEIPGTTSATGKKKKKRSTTSTSTSTNAKKRKSTTPSTASVRISGTDSNQLELVPSNFEFPSVGAQDPVSSGSGKISKLPVKKKTVKKVLSPRDLGTPPAMGTRGKMATPPDSPAMGTRSKRKLNVC
ncbi:unnamed protein product [Urochloa humidicola]